VIRRTFEVALILAFGSVVTAALYWLFLNTPESNVLMLIVSMALVLSLVTAVAITVNAAVLRARGASVRTAVAAGSRGMGWFLLVVLPLLLAWWAIGRGDDWIARHQGEINAWFIARFDWADITRLLQTEMWVSRWLRWAALPVACVSLLAALLTRERPRSGWFRRAWHWRTLLVATVAFFLLFALPWQLAAWRPPLPPTWIEPAVAGLRLAGVFLLGLIGAAVMIVASAGSAATGYPGQLDRQPHD
jgi:hypothetical protein